MQTEIIRIADRVSYIKASDEPLSADVGMIDGDRFLWLYDVGNLPEVTAYLNSIPKPKCVVLSHFHTDHTGGLAGLKYEKLYVGQKTQKFLNAGEIATDDIYIDDGIKLHIFSLPSSHAQGSLGLEACGYAFLGDGCYSGTKSGREVYNQGLLQAETEVLKSLEAHSFLLSHKTPFVRRRTSVVRWLEKIYSKRLKNEPYIEI